jgi:2-keto-4-pentenoate hydratase
MDQHVIQEIAQRLRQATATGQPVTPDAPAGFDLASAYKVARATRDMAVATGKRVAGYKVGLTSAPARQAYDATEPAAGYLLADTVIPSGGTVPTRTLLNPSVEVEVAFVLADSLETADITAHDVLKATAALAPALEIVCSRWDGGPGNLPMLVADNTNAAAAVIGERVAPPSDLASVSSVLTIGGQSVHGSASAVLGNPAEAVAWLARHLITSGTPLQAGDIVLSGTLSTPVPLDTSREVHAEIKGLGAVSASFA